MSATFSRLAVVGALGLLALAGCSPGGSGAKFDTELPMTEFMGHFVDPAAQLYWKNSGWDVTEAGETERFPTTDEGWDVLVTGATTLIEAGNALQLEGRVRAPESEWLKYAQAMTAQAKIARDVAEKHDKQAVFDEGGKLYQTCVACHEKFIIEPQEAAGGATKADPLPTLPQPK